MSQGCKKYNLGVFVKSLCGLFIVTFIFLAIISIVYATSTTTTWTFNAANSANYTTSLATVDNSGAYPVSGVNKFTNPSFESNTNSWTYAAVSSPTLTVSGNEITDATRTANLQGDGVTPPNSSYGIWPATTNLITNGGFETNTAGWTDVSSTTTRITTQFKFGAASGNVVTSNLTVNEGPYQNFTATAAIYTVSAWVRGDAGGTVRVAVRDNAGANAQLGTAVTLTSSWQRITLTTTALTAATWRTYIETNVQQSITFQIDGVQAELSSMATPYVETNGSTATRAAARVQAPSSLINPTQSWVAIRYRISRSTPQTALFGRMFDWGTVSNNAIYLSWNGSGASNVPFYVTRQTTTGTGNSLAPTINDVSVGSIVTLVFAWDANKIYLSYNGGAFSSTAAVVPNMSAYPTFNIGSAGTGTLAGGDYLWFAAGTGTLTNTDASTINGFGNIDPNSTSFSDTATVSAIWSADTATYTSGSASRDTSVTYLSSAGSAKIYAPQTANFTQNVNVGDTSSYTLNAYVYKDGTAVSGTDASLYYNGSTIITTYTPMGGGWYKLSGTLTGANSSLPYGLQVTAGTTIYADDLTLYKTGEYSVYNTTAYSNANLVSWNSFTPTTTITGNSSIGYQICLDDGSSCSYSSGSRWMYYTGSAWANATDAVATNSAAQITTAAMNALSTTSKKISVKSVFGFGGISTPLLSSIQIGLTTNVAPNTPSSLGPTAFVNGSAGTNNQPTLTFSLSDNDVGDTVKYEIQISTHSDLSSPVVDYTSALAAQGSFSFTVGQAAGSGTYNGGVGSSGQTLADGSYYWRVKAIDNGSLSSSYTTANSGSVAFVVDTGNPTTPGTPSTTSPTNSITQTWIWTASTDALSGIASYAWRVTDSSNNPIVNGITTSLSVVTNLTQGIYNFFVKALNGVGTYGSESSSSVTVDTTAPVATDNVASSWYTSPVTITLACSNSGGSTCAHTYYTTDGTTPTTSSSSGNSFTLSADGIYTIKYFSVNTAGDTEAVQTAANQVKIDATQPIGFNLDSPGDNSYTNSDRPTFRWNVPANADATSGLSKYVLVVNNPSLGSNQPSGNFTIDNIPTSGTADINTNKYTIHFDGFNDSDTTNNYISVYTKSSSDWGTDNNDGKVREGKVNWKVEAIDNASNETDESRTLFVDRTNPQVSIFQIDATAYSANSSSSFTTINKTPTVFGTITDNLGGTILDGQTQDANGPQIASGPKSIEVKLEQQGFLGTYSLNTLTTVNLTQSFFTSNNSLVTDNSKNPSAKYSTFSYLLPQGLSYGTYRLTFTPQDNAGNQGGATVFSMIIGVTSLQTQQNTTTVQNNNQPENNFLFPSPTVTPSLSPTKTHQQQAIEIKPQKGQQGPGLASRILSSIVGFGANVIRYLASVFSSGANYIANGVKTPAHLIGNIGTWLSYTAVTFPEMVLDNQPTKIYNVKISQVTKTSAVISWKTNQHTFNNKVNYGTDLSYGNDAFAADYQKDHSVKISHLKPGLKYVFEVMSQSKNYVYDSNHEFTTKGK